MSTSSYIDLPLGIGQRTAFVEASLDSWIKGRMEGDQPIACGVSVQLCGYMDTFFKNECRWHGLYPVIDGDIQRRWYFHSALRWLKLEFNYVGISKAISLMQPNWGYKSRPEWSHQEDTRTYDFLKGFKDDVKAQIVIGRIGTDVPQALSVTMH